MDQNTDTVDVCSEWDRAWPKSEKEFEECIDIFSDRLFEAAFRRLGRVHDAEDVLQIVFMKAFQATANDKKYVSVLISTKW